jgi:hypothetical protein
MHALKLSAFRAKAAGTCSRGAFQDLTDAVEKVLVIIAES